MQIAQQKTWEFALGVQQTFPSWTKNDLLGIVMGDRRSAELSGFPIFQTLTLPLLQPEISRVLPWSIARAVTIPLCCVRLATGRQLTDRVGRVSIRREKNVSNTLTALFEKKQDLLLLDGSGTFVNKRWHLRLWSWYPIKNWSVKRFSSRQPQTQTSAE